MFLVLTSAKGLSAQTFWTGKNGVYGGTANGIVSHAATGALITVTDGGIYRSADNGATWSKITTGIATNDIYMRGITQDNTGKLYCNTSSRVYSSTDGGITWVQTTTVLGSFGSYIKVSPNGNIYLANSNHNQILRSTDGGQTFSATTFSNSNITDIEINSSGHIIVSVYGQSALYISTNNGINWTTMSSGSYTGFPTLNVNYSYKIAIDASDNLYIITDVGPYRLAAGATAWSNIKGTLSDSFFFGDIFSGGSSVFLLNGSSSKIFTYSSGAWNSGVAYPVTSYSVSYFLPKSSSEFYLGMAMFGIFKSTNSGVAWSFSSNGIKAHTYTDFYITPNGRLFAATGNNGYILSLDDGQTWDLNNSGNANRNIYGFVTLFDNTILGYGGSGVIRSVDNGNNWGVQNPSQAIYSKVVVNGTKLFAYSGSTLLTSLNAGVTWASTVISGLPTPTKILVDANDNLYFLATNSIYKVNAGGSTATQITAISSVRDFTITGGTILALATNGTVLATSTNGGTNWTTQTLNSSFYSYRIWAYNASVILTQGNLIGSSYLSTDGGLTWSSKPLLDGSGLADVEFRVPSGNKVYAYGAVSYSVIHKSANEIIPPAAPTNLSLTSNGTGYAEFIWTDNATNEDNYGIEVSEGNNSSYAVYGNGNAGKFGQEVGYITNMGYGAITTEPGKTYFIRVYAKNGAGNSSYSNEISVTTINQCATTIPDNRSWTATTVADPGYTPFGTGPYTSPNVSIKLVPSPSNTFTLSKYVLGIINPGDHPDGNITIQESCGQAYVYTSNNDINNTNGTWNQSTKTLVIKWRTLPDYDDFAATTTLVLNSSDPIPAAPSLTVYPFSSTEVLLNWNQPGFETQYILERATAAGGPYSVVTTVNYPKTSFIDESLTTGSQYFYRIKAVNLAGSSAFSAVQPITLTSGQYFRPVENSISLNFENQQGVSWGDLDGDGDEDIASPSFTNSAGLSVPPVFYENKGGGTFDRRDLQVLANDNDAVSRGINIVDFNNDGKLDMYITRSGTSIADILLINNGNWAFTRSLVDITSEVSTAFRSAAAVDYNRDGLLDIFVGNEPANLAPPSAPGFLFKNLNGNTFSKDVSSSLGTDLINSRIASWADYDNDGDQDLLTANTVNPGQPMRLYKNNGDGTFTRVTGTAFDSDLMINTRTISWGDIDNDGDLDVYIGISTGSLSATFNDRLYRNDGNDVFTSLTTSEAAANGTATFGSAFGDIDNDGDLDLLVANAVSVAVPNSGANGIFINNGAGVFTKSTSNELFTNPNTYEIGLALADFDQDGFLDAYPAKGQTATIDLPNFLYKNNGTLTSSKNWIEIKLEGTTSNKAAIGARVKVITTSPARTQIREVSSRTGYGSQNSLIQHFGLGSATAISQIEVRWPSGQTQILPNVSPVNRIITIKEDFTAPTFTFNPAHNSTDVVITNKLELTLSEQATAAGGKNLVVRKTSSTATPLQTIAVTAGVMGANNKVTFTLSANFDYSTDYFVSIDAGAFVDAYQNASAAVPAANWKFTTQAEPDITPPTITFTPPASLPKSTLGAQKLEVIASDNKGIATVTMFHRKITEENFKSFAGIFNSTTSKYDFPLSESYVDNMGMEYYFEATDAATNTVRNPVGSDFHHLRLLFGTNEKAITLTASTAKTGYRIKSFPYEDTKSVGLVFEALGAPDPKKWRLLQYQHTPQRWIEGFNNVERGVGYFVLTSEAATIKFDNSESPNFSQSNPKTLALKQGFNLIGNPYNVPISWEEIRAGIAGVGVLKTFSGSYANGDIINEFEGGFVFADNAVSVPVKFKTTAGGRKSRKEIGSDLADENWIVPITLKQGDNTFNFGGVGMSTEASPSYDDLDDFAPPAIMEKLEMQFVHPEHFMKVFSRDVVATNSYHEWEFNVVADLSESTEMHWNNDTFGENSNELYLLDMVRQQLIDMRTVSQYTFNPVVSTRFKVFFGANLSTRVKPEGIFLGDAYPNPTTNKVTIPFTVSGTKSAYQVKLELLDVFGRRIATLVDKDLPPGFYSAEWHALENDNQPVNGLLICRLVVAGANKADTYTSKILINK